MTLDGCVALPRGAMGLSAVRDCGISRSNLLTIFEMMFKRPLSHCYLPYRSLFNWKINKVVFENEGAVCLLVTLSKHIMVLNKSIIWPLNARMRFLILEII